jgi:hypothetical protein
MPDYLDEFERTQNLGYPYDPILGGESMSDGLQELEYYEEDIPGSKPSPRPDTPFQ